MMTYWTMLNVMKMDCMVVVCNLLQILLILAFEGIHGYQVRFVIPPSCRSGFVLRDPEDKLILQLSLIHSSYSASITVSNGCHDNSDPGGCVVKGKVSKLGVYRVRPTDVSNSDCYKTFNVSENPPEYVVNMTTNRSDISMVTKDFSNVEVNTAVTDQNQRVPDTTGTTNRQDVAMVTTDFSFVEVYTKVTERDKENHQNHIIVVAIVVPILVLMVAIIAIVTLVLTRTFKRRRKRRDIQPEDPPTENRVDNQVYDSGENSIYAEIDNCVMSDESPAYDYVTNNDLQAKPATSADYITPVSCNDKDLKTQVTTTSDDCYLVPLNKRSLVYEALGDNASDEYASLDQQNMSMYHK